MAGTLIERWFDVIAFPEGTAARATDDEARSLKKWNQLWYNAYGNVGSVPYPEGTEPLPGDDAHRSEVKLQAMKKAVASASYGPSLVSGSYDVEGFYTVVGLAAGQQYLLTLGASEIAVGGVLQIGNSPYQTISANGVFTAQASAGVLMLTGSPSYESLATSGLLIVGRVYFVDDPHAGDDFSNVGQVDSNPFTATGTTPANWTHGSEVALFYKATASIQRVL